MTNQNYCTDCNETIQMHADGSCACSCDMLDANSAAIPKAWKLTQEELAEARLAEKEYSANEEVA